MIVLKRKLWEKINVTTSAFYMLYIILLLYDIITILSYITLHVILYTFLMKYLDILTYIIIYYVLYYIYIFIFDEIFRYFNMRAFLCVLK